MGATARRRWRRAPGSLALLTTLVVLSSFFVIAGAQVASAAQCGQVNNPPACSLKFRFENPAKSSIYTDTSPHQAAVGETISRTDLNPNPSGGAVVVEVEDATGHRDTNYAGQITVALCDQPTCPPASGNLTGGDPVPAVSGAAFFTNLSIDTKGYFQLTATATGPGILPVTSGTFRIQADECASGQTCSDSAAMMDANLTNGGTGTIGLSVGIDNLSDCSTLSDQFFFAPAEWTVDEVSATGTGTKVLAIRIDKTWRQIVVDKGTQSYRPCITATVQPPATWNNTGSIPETTGEFTFLAPDCTKTITYFCRAYVKSNKSGDVIEGISLPSGSIVGDPRGH
jgi:hypothetical protein